MRIMSNYRDEKLITVDYQDKTSDMVSDIPEKDKKVSEFVLVTSMNFPSGGAGATYLNLFCRAMKLSGTNISVLLLKGYGFGNYTYNGPSNNVTEDGVPYTYLGFKQRPDKILLKLFEEIKSLYNLVFYLIRLFRKRRNVTLLVYNSEVHFNIPIFLISRSFKIKTVKFVAEFVDKSEFTKSFFGEIKRYGYIFNFNHINNLSDKLIVFSFFLKDKYLKIGFKEKDIFVQPNLTDFDFWKMENAEIKYTLGYSGAPYLKDGLHDLFKAISILNNKNSDISLLVIGDAVFGQSLIPALKKECERLGISEKVHFTGLVESSMVKKYLSECQMLILTRPSTTQTKAGFPTKLGEYFASGKPVLTTNFGDMEKYFTDGKDIIMAKCGDPESIASRISWMLQNEEKMEHITSEGYKRARQVLEYQNSVKRMINFINFN